MIEPVERGLDAVSLSHLEILSEVLVSAPPVGPDHAQSLVSSNLMEVRVSHVVLLSVYRESAIRVRSTMSLVSLADSVSPVEDHSFLV